MAKGKRQPKPPADATPSPSPAPAEAPVVAPDVVGHKRSAKDTASIETVLLSHDYLSLLEHTGRAIENLARVTLLEASFVLRHPEDAGVRMRVRLKDSVITAGRPFSPAENIDEFLFDFRNVVLLGRGGVPIYGVEDIALPPTPPENLLAIPLRNRDGVEAVLRFDLAAEDITTIERLLTRIEFLAEAAERVLPHCHEHERVRRERNDMQEIFEAATMIQSCETADQVAKLAAEIMVDRLNADRCVVYGYDKRQTVLYPMASFGGTEQPPSAQIPVFDNDDTLARAFRAESSEWHPTIRASQIPTLGVEGGGTISYHAICLPLLVGSRAVGILFADHITNRVQMSPQRLLGVQLFANTVATAIESTRLIAEIGRLADTDSMTGLANRRALNAVLRREVLRASRHDLSISVLMIDIDKFKKINDEYGHLAGDQAIIATAQVLRGATRETDFVSRYGGDEFCVVMPDTDNEQAEIVRQRVIEAARLKAPELNRSKWKYSLSCGVRSARGEAAEELLHEADKALYEHKEAQVRSSILQTLLVTSPDELGTWNHQLGRVLRVLYEKEPHYHSHALRVMNLCVSVAQRENWAKDDLECVALAALLHDVGKISIPTPVLTRPGPLSPREYRLVQDHPKIGRDLLKDIPYIGDVVELVASHHERWDGNRHCEFPAYPGELSGDRIPRGARLLKIADSFDAMTSPRPYSTPVSTRRALEILREEAGRSFDPELAELVARWIEECESRPLVPVHA